MPVQTVRTSADQHLPALTGLRFYLALWVVVHHLSGGARMLEPWVRNFPDPIQTFLRSGFWAVGTFFVLSGFVLARGYASLRWDRTSLVRYAAARIARIYPVYAVSLVLIAPFAIQDLFVRSNAAVLASRAALITNYTLVLQGWTGTLPVQWNTPAWSLSCELFFYLCFPLVLFFARCTNWRRSAAVAGIALALPVLFHVGRVPEIWKPLLHLGDFLLGIGSAGIYDALTRSHPEFVGRGYRLYLPASVLFVGLVALPRMVEYWIPVDSLLRPLNAVLLVGLALGGGHAARMLSGSATVLLGKASYALYILHVPLLWWYKRSPLFRAAAPSSLGASLLFIASAILVSTVVFKLIEEPANRILRQALVRPISPLLDNSGRWNASASFCCLSFRGLRARSPSAIFLNKSLKTSSEKIPSSQPILAAMTTTTAGPTGAEPREPNVVRASASGSSS